MLFRSLAGSIRQIARGGFERKMFRVQPKGSSDQMNIKAEEEGRIWDDFQNSSALEKTQHLTYLLKRQEA